MELLEEIKDAIWGPALVSLCLFCAAYFSIGTRFVQIRRFREMMRLLFKGESKKDKIGTTSFQAFCIALSGRVGVGNIVGVATAIGFGGPGAIVWMWIIAIFGAATAFSESTLSQIYKIEYNGTFRGSPAQYIKSGLGLRKVSIIYSLILTIAFGFFCCPIQSHEIAEAVPASLEIPHIYIGIGCAIFLAYLIWGGINRIAHFSQIVCPILVIVYMGIAIVVLIMHIKIVPGLIADMIRGAFGMDPILGGILGYTILWGVKRGIYSNEAGQGSGAIVSGSASVSHPVKQGLAQSFSVYIDTLIVCTSTAVMILACKTYNVLSPQPGAITYLIENPGAPGGYPDLGYTVSAIATVTGHFTAQIFSAVVLFFFAFTTIMGYYYYAETNIIYFLTSFKKRPAILDKIIINILRIVICCSVIIGAVTENSTSWAMGDAGIGIMVWMNLIAILLLSPKVFRTLKDYERQKKEGLDPKFDPEKLGIKDTECWSKEDL